MKRAQSGKFESQYKERRGRPLAFRLPESLDNRLFDYVGDRPWRPIVEQAIREFLDRQ